jgi:uncharacterized membrane protein YhaH (DUF805 family)
MSYALDFALLGASGTLDGPEKLTIPYLIALIIFWIPGPALYVRRAHDIGFPAGVGILTLLPSLGQFFVPETWLTMPSFQVSFLILGVASLVFLLWKPQEGANGYGPDPRLELE